MALRRLAFSDKGLRITVAGHDEAWIQTNRAVVDPDAQSR